MVLPGETQLIAPSDYKNLFRERKAKGIVVRQATSRKNILEACQMPRTQSNSRAIKGKRSSRVSLRRASFKNRSLPRMKKGLGRIASFNKQHSAKGKRLSARSNTSLRRPSNLSRASQLSAIKLNVDVVNQVPPVPPQPTFWQFCCWILTCCGCCICSCGPFTKQEDQVSQRQTRLLKNQTQSYVLYPKVSGFDDSQLQASKGLSKTKQAQLQLQFSKITSENEKDTQTAL